MRGTLGETSMLTNRTIQRRTHGAAKPAPRWSCVSLASGVVAANMRGVSCLSSLPAYLLGGESGHQNAANINDPRFTDQHNLN